MSGKNQIPNALIDAEIYINGSNNLAGIGEVECPTIEYDTVTIEQMGLTGELEVPLMGHFKKLEAKIKMDCIDDTAPDLNNGKPILVECKGAAQATNKSTHGADIYGIDATFKGFLKKMDGVKIKPGVKLESSFELSLTYYKLEINGKSLVEIDVINNVNTVHGMNNDVIRKFLGL